MLLSSLDIRVLYEKGVTHDFANAALIVVLQEDAYTLLDDQNLCADAERLACRLGYELFEDSTPLQFRSVPRLDLAYQEGRERQFEDNNKREHKYAELMRLEQVKAMVAEGNWASLHLPTPDELLGSLLSGKNVEVRGHSLSYVDEEQLTWYTNPYGQDGILGEIPDSNMVAAFLRNIALGHEYGRVPY